ncbi:MAG: OsmC family protein [Armatimonadota bacterium]
MVVIEVDYPASKRCRLVHPEGHQIDTDAPRDIGGDASAFSPTDMVAGALAACVLTTIGMFAERHSIDLVGMRAVVGKEMNATPRRIGRLPVTVHMPASVPEEMRPVLEKVGRTCPVHASLHPEVDAPITYVYND